MDIFNKKVGIWGFSVVGRSLINFLIDKAELSVLEKREFNEDEINFFKKNNISYFNQNNPLNFFLNTDFIIPSPGIDLRNFNQYQNKWLSELDLFSLYFKKPVIAITGTVGKTTISHILANLLQLKNIKTIAAGNIGIGMCDLIEKQNDIDCVVLEVSSFQLENCKIFKPNLAIVTNLYPNHLDRHHTLDEYFNAKLKIIINQNKNDKFLINFDLYEKIKGVKQGDLAGNFFTIKKIDEFVLNGNCCLFFIENNLIKKYQNNSYEIIFDVSKLPSITFNENWLIIISSLYLLNIDLNQIEKLSTQVTLPQHRLEKLSNINDVEFYNDSKSTIADSTLAAISKFKTDQIILFLGGLSKGVDRSCLIKDLKNKVKCIITFGQEASHLKNLCDQNLINSKNFDSLENAISYCFTIMQPGDIVLFSPAGSSYDLFSNYEERGKKFKEIVQRYL